MQRARCTLLITRSITAVWILIMTWQQPSLKQWNMTPGHSEASHDPWWRTDMKDTSFNVFAPRPSLLHETQSIQNVSYTYLWCHGKTLEDETHSFTSHFNLKYVNKDVVVCKKTNCEWKKAMKPKTSVLIWRASSQLKHKPIYKTFILEIQFQKTF